MYMTNILTAFKARKLMDAQQCTFLFSLPEENPIIFVYEINHDDEISYWSTEETKTGLIIREIEDQKELDAIKDRDFSKQGEAKDIKAL